jgi:hypothetical protein
MIDDGYLDEALSILTAIRDQDPTTDWGIEAESQIQQITALQNQTLNSQL